MSQILDHDMDSLDLYMEVLRIVHHHPRSDASGVFTHATLAMDTSSCQNALDSLVHHYGQRYQNPDSGQARW